MNLTLDKVYDPKAVEAEIFKLWEVSGAFRAEPDDRPPDQRFVVMMPLPNITGALHMGHAVNNTLQDVQTRFHRMKGYNTLWQPGTDHAGIATQAVVEKRIFEQEGKTRHNLAETPEKSREELVRRIWEWKDQYQARIVGQLRSMGFSCDWERMRFTLDKGYETAVRHTFFKWFKDGLIFRGKRLVNWDTTLQTAVADDEVYHETVKGKLTQIRYPVISGSQPALGSSGGTGLQPVSEQSRDRVEDLAGRREGAGSFLVVATTRPETMLGDTALAVHPEDLRYKHLIGQQVMLPLMNRPIPIIADPILVDPKFGTGVVKVTPAHDPNDYQTGQRHNLPMINVLTPDGRINENGRGQPDADGRVFDYSGMPYVEARKKVVSDLEALGLIEKIEDYAHQVGHSDRSKTPIQPYLSDQWFVKMGDISEPRTSVGADANTQENEPRTSVRADVPARRHPTPDLSAGAILMTWTTYGTWLPGDERGFVSRVAQPDGTHVVHNLPGEPFDEDDAQLRASAQERMEGQPAYLNADQAETLLSSVAASCERHGIELLTVAIMRNHVHVLCQSERSGQDLLKLIKGAASHDLGKQFSLPGAPRWFTRRGSTRFIRKGADLSPAMDYVRHQEHALLVWAFDVERGKEAELVRSARLRESTSARTEVRDSINNTRGAGEGSASDSRESARTEVRGSINNTRDAGEGSASDSRESARTEVRGSQGVVLGDGSMAPGLAQAAIDALCQEDAHYEGADAVGRRQTCNKIHIFPRRYCKTYLDWLGEKRDWCISRQLWWGHRIPVWTFSMALGGTRAGSLDPALTTSHVRKEAARVDGYDEQGRAYGLSLYYICFEGDPTKQEIRELREAGWMQDDNVLDTWFSSQLWPFATLGWPEVEEFEHNRQSAIGNRKSNALGGAPGDRTPARTEVRGSQADSTSARTEVRGSLDYYYPGSVLITSRDIITLWVARMVIAGLYNMGDVPFRDVYIHTKILDGRGDTMSKSRGNGVDPVDIIDLYGADALRYSVVDLATENQDVRMPVDYRCPHCEHLTPQTSVVPHNKLPIDIKQVVCKSCKKPFATQWADEATKQQLGVARESSDRFEMGRNFCNKVWNAARYVFMNLSDQSRDRVEDLAGRREGAGSENAERGTLNVELKKINLQELPTEDRWILAKLSETCRTVDDLLTRYQFAATVKTLRDFFWDNLCDWYVELTKGRLNGGTQAAEARQVLAFVMDQALRLMHPIMPFITERLWRQLNETAPVRGLPGLAEPGSSELLIAAEFPPAEGWPKLDDPRILEVFDELRAATVGVRNLRSQCNVSPKTAVKVTLKCPAKDVDAIRTQAGVVKQMAGVIELIVDPAARRPKNAATTTVGALQIIVHDISDDDAERARCQKELGSIEGQIAGKNSKLANEKFVANADPEVVQAERDKLAELKLRKETLIKTLAELAA